MKTISVYEQINKVYNNLLNRENRIPLSFIFLLEHNDMDWWFYVNNWLFSKLLYNANDKNSKCVWKKGVSKVNNWLMLLQQYNQSRFETGYKIEKKYLNRKVKFFYTSNQILFLFWLLYKIIYIFFLLILFFLGNNNFEFIIGYHVYLPLYSVSLV